MIAPSSCSKKAYEFFEEQVTILDSNLGMVNASLAIAMHSFDDLDCRKVWQKINLLAAKIAQRIEATKTKSAIEQLNQAMFVDEGFVASADNHRSHLLDSMLSLVIELRVGTPELVGLIYKVVAEQNGIDVQPVTYRSRLCFRVNDNDGWLLVDLCQPARILSFEELEVGWIVLISHREWIERILCRNMKVLRHWGRFQDHAAMEELQRVLASDAEQAI